MKTKGLHKQVKLLLRGQFKSPSSSFLSNFVRRSISSRSRRRIMHLSIEIPTPPPPRAKVGECGGFLWYLKARFARGGGGFLRICFTHSSKSGSEVGIGLVPSFLAVICSCCHWCRSLDFDGLRFAVLFRHRVLKGRFPNYFSF